MNYQSHSISTWLLYSLTSWTPKYLMRQNLLISVFYSLGLSVGSWFWRSSSILYFLSWLLVILRSNILRIRSQARENQKLNIWRESLSLKIMEAKLISQRGLIRWNLRLKAINMAKITLNKNPCTMTSRKLSLCLLRSRKNRLMRWIKL